MAEIIKIGIAEDHDILRQTMSKLLNAEPNFNVRIEACNGRELLDEMKKKRIDIVILDLNMPVLDGKETLKVISNMNDEMRPGVIILSMHDTESHIRKYLGLGANAFLSKGCEYPELVKAIKDVHKNGFYFDDVVTRELVSEVIRNSRSSARIAVGNPLSDRETEIVQLLCKQKTNQEISELLGISLRTVENHRLHIMKKIGAKNSIGLLVYAMRNGLLDIEQL